MNVIIDHEGDEYEEKQTTNTEQNSSQTQTTSDSQPLPQRPQNQQTNQS